MPGRTGHRIQIDEERRGMYRRWWQISHLVSIVIEKHAFLSKRKEKALIENVHRIDMGFVWYV